MWSSAWKTIGLGGNSVEVEVLDTCKSVDSSCSVSVTTYAKETGSVDCSCVGSYACYE